MRLSLFIFIFTTSFNLFSAVINVPADYTTISAAVGASAAADTVLVQPGTYTENVFFPYHNITLGSLYLTTEDQTYISSTVISGTVFLDDGLIDNSTLFTGFTVTDGNNDKGGGVYIDNGISPNLKNLVITGNTGSEGGGLYCGTSSAPTLTNVTITDNTGYGIYCSDGGDLTLINTIVWSNSGSEIEFDPMSDPSSITVSYSDIQGGSPSGNGTVNWLAGNINSDPLFADPSNVDYSLQSTSPCIDSGDPASPFDPDGTRADMGGIFWPYEIDADFRSDTVSGVLPLTVSFTDQSSASLDISRSWDFGDNNYSTLQNPVHEYTQEGVYTVTLSITDLRDSTVTEEKTDFIVVHSEDYTGPVWHVSETGSDSYGNGSEEYPFASIQMGIDTASNTNIVLVQPGTYVENINYNGKNITVASLYHTTQDTSFISSTVIDGDSLASVVIFNHGEDSTSVLKGFTITNGSASNGGGIYTEDSGPSLEDLVVKGNHSTSYGGGICLFGVGTNPSSIIKNVKIYDNNCNSSAGGIFCWQTDLTLENAEIYYNSARSAGGISCSYMDLIMKNVDIHNNSATGSGSGGGFICEEINPDFINVKITGNISSNYAGGVLAAGNDMILEDLIISDNHAMYGGGICITSTSPVLRNIEISRNTAAYGGGMYCVEASPVLENLNIVANTVTSSVGGIFCESNCDPVIKNSIVRNNTSTEIYVWESEITISYSDINGGEAAVAQTNGIINWGIGNIDQDPLFADYDNGNYRLKWSNFPVIDGTMSPCIDSGDPESELDPDSTRTDMGCYYFPQEYSEFEADATRGVAPFTVNFTDNSFIVSAVVNEWYWDFGDGNYSAFQNPEHIYNEPGYHTVTLIVTLANDSTYSEIKTDYIAVSADEQPLVPGNIIISTVGNDVELSWDDVNESVSGHFVNPYYVVYGSSLPNSGYSFLGLTQDTHYTHQYIGQFSKKNFYKVTAYVGDLSKLKDLIIDKNIVKRDRKENK